MSLATAPAESAYERDRRLAFQGAAPERAALAGAAGTPPEILYYLAADPAAAVRGALAGNLATPPQADARLATDELPEVRAVLGRKLAALAPGLSADQHDRLRQSSWRTLCTLVQDSATEVRAAIAEALQDMPDAPRGLILQLARDVEMSVAEPVIRLSPLLTDEDLLALVEHPPVRETVTAVARRPAISEAISEAIVATADPGAVAALLENSSACIRESTLDALIANAAQHGEWHEPLVRRPALSSRAARALSEIVAAQLLGLLAARSDLDAGLAEELAQKVAARLPAAEQPPLPEDREPRFLAAAARGDRDAMAALLAAAANVAPALVSRAVALRSAKALVSLCWQAGFDCASAEHAQAVLAQMAPAAQLPCPPGGPWPLGPDEMSWQMELLGNM